ncbi:MAG: hypothetical protein JOZ71_05785 [Ktedonobacteraceae bacterium]|nr:hypothetical protein [Ktedonobacteraceae bacterium]
MTFGVTRRDRAPIDEVTGRKHDHSFGVWSTSVEWTCLSQGPFEEIRWSQAQLVVLAYFI